MGQHKKMGFLRRVHNVVLNGQQDLLQEAVQTFHLEAAGKIISAIGLQERKKSSLIISGENHNFQEINFFLTDSLLSLYNWV